MRFLEERFAANRKLKTAFCANYRRFMDTDVDQFPNPRNALDQATSEAYNTDIAEIRKAPTRRNQNKRTKKTTNNSEEYVYDNDDDDENI